MKGVFPEYYRPSEAEFRSLWESCFFALDANVLLNVYRYSEPTTQQFLGLLERLASRIWEPHQFALEYQRNRLVVILEQLRNYTEAEGTLRTLYENQLLPKTKHPFLSDNMLQAYRRIQEDLGARKAKHEAFLTNDPHFERLTDILKNVGKPPTDLGKLHQLAKSRYQENRPPGYADLKEKKEPEAFGDFIGWTQLIEISKSEQKPAILVTDDAKDDWWQIVGGRNIGPRPELIAEFRTECGQSFHMYGTLRFMEFAEVYLHIKVEQGAIEEIRERSKEQEQLQRVSDTKPAAPPPVEIPSDEKPFIPSEKPTPQDLKPTSLPPASQTELKHVPQKP